MSLFTQYKKTDFGIAANQVDLANLTDIKVPKKLEYGVPVLNKQGYVRVSRNEYVDDFVKFSSTTDYPVMEIGCAYGHVVHEVLRKGGEITACDLDEKHLEILIRECPRDYINNLYVVPGQFPDEINFSQETFSAIMASRVLHFLDGNTLEKGLKKIYDWLVPNGKFYFISLSIHKNYLRDGCLQQYQKNLELGKRWPGEIEDQHKFAQEHELYAPKFIHVFDVPQLESILPEFGFEVEKISLFDYPDDMKSGNKGHIGFIAKKV